MCRWVCVCRFGFAPLDPIARTVRFGDPMLWKVAAFMAMRQQGSRRLTCFLQGFANHVPKAYAASGQHAHFQFDAHVHLADGLQVCAVHRHILVNRVHVDYPVLPNASLFVQVLLLAEVLSPGAFGDYLHGKIRGAFAGPAVGQFFPVADNQDIGLDYNLVGPVVLVALRGKRRTSRGAIMQGMPSINNPTMNGGVCCFGKVIFVGYIPSEDNKIPRSKLRGISFSRGNGLGDNTLHSAFSFNRCKQRGINPSPRINSQWTSSPQDR